MSSGCGTFAFPERGWSVTAFFFEVYEDADVLIGDHPMQQYNERRWMLGVPPLAGLSLREEIRLLLMISQPCELPDEIVQERLEHNDGIRVEYWHTHPFRFVVYTLPTGHKKLFTVDPDIHPNNPGMWREFEELLGRVRLEGFTIEEITRGIITMVRASKQGRHDEQAAQEREP